MTIQNCQYCDKPYTTNTHNHKYCTPICTLLAQRQKVKVQKDMGKCQWCGSPFSTFSEYRRWCMPEHGALYRKQEQHIKSRYEGTKRKIELEKLAQLGINYKLPPREVD